MTDPQLEQLLAKLTPAAPSPHVRQAIGQQLDQAAAPPVLAGRIRPATLLAWASAAAACIVLLLSLAQWLISVAQERPHWRAIALMPATPDDTTPTQADLDAALGLPRLSDEQLRQLPLSDAACLLAAHSGPGSRDRYMDYRAQESSLGKPLFPSP